MPRIFSDNYSFATAHFEIGEEPLPTGINPSKSSTWTAPIPGVPGGRSPKGVIGWLSDQTLVVLGAGQDARWEKFALTVAQDGRRIVVREGWRKYLE